ncbi:Uncharacterised protein [Serratia fonticola]|nr:Uncharacterised protein [Serratia fonticola]CAI0922058.1 Uncharacterised protein [Serratia fonticola]CAI1505811.1 Uncharacterised protein [Serratia fonticola]CAI1766399.1 Uncharacterised protein [Serratia fonticola]
MATDTYVKLNLSYKTNTTILMCHKQDHSNTVTGIILLLAHSFAMA